MAGPEHSFTWGTPAPPAPPKPRPQRLWLHAALFVLTFLSAMWSQSLDMMHAATFTDGFLAPLSNPEQLKHGLIFAVTLMTILLAHEMGHYLTARRYGVDQSLPYFIPAPTFFGTLGAVILMRSQPPNRRVLLLVAVMGPYAGLLLALPAAAWGLAHSTAADALALGQGDYWFGASILWEVLVHAFAPHADALSLHPVALGAWVGMFVTCLNLIPAAQLDGGHVAYALFGRRQEQISRVVVVLLFAVGVLLGGLRSAGFIWVVWALVLFALGLKHPPVRDELRPLSRFDRMNGYFALVVFLLTFIPVPIEFRPGDEGERPYGRERVAPGQERDDSGAHDGGGEAEEFRL